MRTRPDYPTRFNDVAAPNKTRHAKFLSEEPDFRAGSLFPDRRRTAERIAFIRSAVHPRKKTTTPHRG
jgi:hypothetical protein